MTKVLKLTLVTLLFALISYAQEEAEVNPLSVIAEIQPSDLSPGAQFKLELKLSLLPGFKAYEDQFRLESEQPQDLKLGALKIQGGHDFYDKFSKKDRRGVKGNGQITVLAELPLKVDSRLRELKLNLSYQACAETYCLFPKTIELKIPMELLSAEKKMLPKSEGILQHTFMDAQERGIAFVIFFVFIAGVLTSLTPCILPMLPITIAILGKGHPARKKRTRFFHALVYVLGMSLTYSLLGLMAASSGALFGALLSHPAVQIFFALLFIGMGIAAFGFFEVQTPLFLQNKVNKLAKLPGNFGIFMAGMVSGIIAGPCVGPVLVGILTYVAQTQDVWLGALLLFVYSLGLGQLLIILGVSTHLLDRMPKNGNLMKVAKILLGMALIAAGLFYLSLVMPKMEIYKGPQEEVSFQKLPWQPYSAEGFKVAQLSGKPIILDFYAEWCLACKELEQYTFTDDEVRSALASYQLIKFDATNESEELSQLKKQYGIVGLPTLLIFNAKGQWQKQLTINEFLKPEVFLERLQRNSAL